MKILTKPLNRKLREDLSPKLRSFIIFYFRCLSQTSDSKEIKVSNKETNEMSEYSTLLMCCCKWKMKTLLPTAYVWLIKDLLHSKSRKKGIPEDVHWACSQLTLPWWDTMMRCGLARWVNSQMLRWKRQRNPAASQCASQLRPSPRRGSWVHYWRTNVTSSCALTCQSNWPMSKFLCVLYSKWVTSLKAKFEHRLFSQLPLGLALFSGRERTELQAKWQGQEELSTFTLAPLFLQCWTPELKDDCIKRYLWTSFNF